MSRNRRPVNSNAFQNFQAGIEALVDERPDVQVRAEGMFALMNPATYGAVSVEEAYTEQQRRSMVDQVLATLTETERLVLIKRFGLNALPMTLQQVGDEMEYCAENVRRIEAKALRKLRHPSRSAPLYNLIDTPYNA